MNPQGIALRLNDRGGHFAGGGSSHDFFACVTSGTLSGDLTISGICNASGQPVAWLIPAGSGAGLYQAPASGRNGGAQMQYSLASAADAGKVTVSWLPTS